ncbi:helix-turn-helix transcriptional regulator [Spirosoma validum]|uniref:Helix-turn-helix transcriptional regulator n=1 Tax=Spirosoma validum TaxID=2771355 RepID=A0A927B5V2_9BACT|nr:AraC family transcriptional regulator [Spirosoma validum]MBD2755893.1 helix-turn-helix transcriptional regulator [Spirosoma validum]
MATTVVNSCELTDFVSLPHPHQLGPPASRTPTDTFTYFHHPKAGQFKFNSTFFPHMHVMDMRWNTADDIEIFDSTPSDNIHINFQLKGFMYSRFQGLTHDLDMRPNRHNLIHTPEIGHVNQLKGNQSMELFLISLDKDFFASLIGQNDHWSERLVTDLHNQRSFSAVTGTQIITPQMLYLIEDIRHCKVQGPMRNLLIQSRILELLALEIEQFSTAPVTDETLRPDEVEKLHQLKAYLEANFLSELSLAQLSRVCLLNEFKVKKGFKQLFGTTVFNHIRKLRMEHAGRLLRNCAVSIDDVADVLGYEYAQHFSIAFKKYTGVTPSQYQRNKVLNSALH